MRSAMILCVLATACCISTANAADNAGTADNTGTPDNTGTAALTALKTEVQTTMNNLSSYNENLYHDTQSKLSDLLIVEFSIMTNITNSTLNAIQLEIDQAIEAGKNADHCFEHSRQRIGQAHLESITVLYECFNNAVATVNSVKDSIDAVRQLGNRLTSEFEAIAINCILSNAMATEKCILAKIPEARSSFDAYLNTRDTATRNSDRSSSDAQVSAHECYQPGVQTLRDVTKRVRAEAHQCVANAGISESDLFTS